MTIDYKKELETAAKSMILVHKPDTLIKMIVRILVQKVKVNQASILLYHKDTDAYILTISRGITALKSLKGFAHMVADNPLIHFFKQNFNQQLLNDDALVFDSAKGLLNKDIKPAVKQLLKDALGQMEILGVSVCIPSYFRDELIGLLLLGNKISGGEFVREELNFFVALASDVAMAIKNAQLFRELELELNRNKCLFINTSVALASAIEAKDRYTRGHTTRVTNLALAIATRLMQRKKELFDEKFLENLHIASLLHDIGKIGIPEYILNKRQHLTVGERNKIKEHPAIGVTILEPIRELDKALPGVKYHHEKYDGSGYPDSLRGNQIPLIASIISVADAFDAMTSDRPYRPALSFTMALEEIRKNAGTQFDPQVAEMAIQLYPL